MPSIEKINLMVIPEVSAAGTRYSIKINGINMLHSSSQVIAARTAINLLDLFKSMGYEVEKDDNYPTGGKDVVLVKEVWRLTEPGLTQNSAPKEHTMLAGVSLHKERQPVSTS